MRRDFGGILLVLAILSLAPLTTANAANSNVFKPKPQPEDCPRNPDKTWKYRCLDPDDYARMTEIKINLQEEVKKLRGHRFVRTFHTIGFEFVPETQEVLPYGTFGVSVGGLGIWGGFFGRNPAVGVGYSW